MDTETMRRRIDEKLTGAKLSLQWARRGIQEAADLASTSQDETLNLDIIRDYERIVTQLLSHMDMWRIPVVDDTMSENTLA